MSKTADYRIKLSQLIVPAVSAPAVQPKPSVCYPDRHRRSDKQIAFSTLRTLGATLVGVAVAIGIAVYMGVRYVN
jgi:hypothetical protein